VLKFRQYSNDDLDQHLRNLEIFGYTVVKNYIDKKNVANLKAKTEDYFKIYKKKIINDDVKNLSEDRCIHNLQNLDVNYIELLSSPFIEKILKKKLNDKYHGALPSDYPNYNLSNYTARSAINGLELHIDSFIPSSGGLTWSLQVAFMVDNQTIDNGCSIVVPGSHKSDKYSDRKFENIKPIESEAGDVVIWDSRIWHGNLRNNSGASRWALFATVVCWWVRPNFDVSRGLPNKIYKKLNDRQKILLGFCNISPSTEFERFHTKKGTNFLKSNVKDFF